MKQIWLLGLIIVTLMPALSKAEQAIGYQIPSPALAKLVDAKLIPSSFLSADGKWLALLDRKRVVPLSELNRPEKALAGIKFNPQTFMRQSRYTYVSLEFKHVDTGSVLRPTGLPENGVIRYPQWSSDSRYLSFVVEQDNDATLWLYDVKERETTQLTQSTLNGVVTETPYEWLQVMKNARVCLAPLRFGAGIKGKLLEAMITQTPSVTTAIGAEGMHCDLPWPGSIATNAQDFADQAVALYTDEQAYVLAQIAGKNILNQIYDKTSLESQLIKKITSIIKNIENHRQGNFVGQMLKHHTMRSTQYMAQWIEAKNVNKIR